MLREPRAAGRTQHLARPRLGRCDRLRADWERIRWRFRMPARLSRGATARRWVPGTVDLGFGLRNDLNAPRRSGRALVLGGFVRLGRRNLAGVHADREQQPQLGFDDGIHQPLDPETLSTERPGETTAHALQVRVDRGRILGVDLVFRGNNPRRAR